MRVPIGWLRDFVDIPHSVTHEAVHAALVKVGFEEEDVHGFELSGPVVVGQVLEFTPEPQTNGKTINWCRVDVGPDPSGGRDIRGIVCGAHNFAVGDKVVVSLPGAILPGPFPIAARTTYGHVSDGMIASARELGLGEEHDGILRLASLGLDPVVGSDAISLLGLDDFAVEVNVTPDRGYALSIRGIAREYSHSTGAAFRDPVEAIDTLAPGTGFPVTVDAAPLRDRDAVTVFMTRVVRGVDATRPTPAWMVSRLALAGIRSISLVVDITNYVMVELGQPIHAYDLDRLRGGLTVRRARPGETLETLDHRVRRLDPEDLLIADDSGAIGLAGVMGGAATEIDLASTTVLVEAANFDPVSIARTARRHRLPSEASRRFERGIDPMIADPAAVRVVNLLEKLAGGQADALGSTYDRVVPRSPIELASGFVPGLIGAEFTRDEIAGSLAAIGSRVEETAAGWRVTPPSWRPDLTDPPSLAEEVARIVGYDRIPSVLPVAPPGRGLTRTQRLRRLTAGSLASAGMTEVLSYPFVAQSSNDLFGSPVPGRVAALRLANPIDADAAWMRTSLLPGLIAVARRNLARGLTDLALFESGTVFRPSEGQTHGHGQVPAGARPSDEVLGALRAGIPPQPWHVGGLFLGDAIAKQAGQAAVPAGLADAISAARHLASVLAAPIAVAAGRHQALHPGRTAEFRSGDRVVGYAGELLPTLATSLDLPRVVAVFELDLDALIELGARDVAATPIASLPAATQDVSLVVPESVPAGDVLASLVEGAGELLEHATLVDDYRGTGIPDASKSLTYALRFRAPDRTLTAAEATAAKLAAVAIAASRFGAVLRE